MLAQLEGGQHRKRVRVLGGAHDDGVNVLALIVKLVEVHVFARLRVLGGRGVEVLLVHVAERDNVLALDLGQVGSAASARANDREVELVAGGKAPGPGAGQGRAREGGDAGGDSGAAKELASCQGAWDK